MTDIEKKIIDEIKNFNRINRYLTEQDALAAPPADAAAPGGIPAPAPPLGGGLGAPPAPGALGGENEPGIEDKPVDELENKPIDEEDPEVEKIGPSTDDEGEESEELDITDLVNSQKEISEKQSQAFEDLFNQLKSLESKLENFNNLVNSVESLKNSFEKYRPKTAQEKLELRSLDSGPYNQKLSQYFQDKMPDLEKSGKNEYVLTTDDVEDFSSSDIRDTFDIEKYKDIGLG